MQGSLLKRDFLFDGFQWIEKKDPAEHQLALGEVFLNQIHMKLPPRVRHLGSPAVLLPFL